MGYTPQRPLSQSLQNRPNIPIYADGALCNLRRAERLPFVDAGIHRLRILRRPAPEGIFDDTRRIAAYPQFQVEGGAVAVAAQEVLILPGGPVPTRILDEGFICPQVHGQGPAAVGTMGDQLGGNPQVPLPGHHLPDQGFVVPGLLAAGAGALEEAVIPLGIKEPFLVKARLLEAVVHVGGEDEIILPLHQLQQRLIHRLGWGLVAVQGNEATPIGPVRLWVREGVEATAVHIPKAVAGGEVAKVLPETGPAVGEARRGGQPRPRPDDHGFRSVKGPPEGCRLVPRGPDRSVRRCPCKH